MDRSIYIYLDNDIIIFLFYAATWSFEIVPYFYRTLQVTTKEITLLLFFVLLVNISNHIAIAIFKEMKGKGPRFWFQASLFHLFKEDSLVS